ncbi:peptidase M20 [Lottiidibacillus patelloidae]|uniref:Peptidase M20 n=1 Tax=Lottiidibacillus patelloidae TaxID=2670334 RepID=A0A263BWP7_9BACI|nr:amidohydrolase [Lottiidibacillus patelloidae]OZM58159.1 peptidase M20 [Lottiidibacillus patelloidae]
MDNNLNHLLETMYDEMVSIRRYLHQNPELSFQEVNTPAYIAKFHEQLGHEVKTKVGGRGVVATLRGELPGKTVALRADFDALPIQEQNDFSYKSKVDGVMHACGHDGHTATLLVLAKALNKMKDQLCGTIVFIHQHAEEFAPGGAIAMIEDGCLENVDVIFGTHLWATEKTGNILVSDGPIMAAADRFSIKIIGEGGHGGRPHETKDAIVVASQLVMQLQHIVSRKVDPLEQAVVSIGSFVAKNAFNVIADEAVIEGTVRTFNEDIRDFIEMEIERHIKGVSLANSTDYVYEYNRGYPPVVNHKEEASFIANIAESIDDVNQVKKLVPIMGGEDFAYYLQHVKGVFFFTGARDETRASVYPHHHPKFNFDEKGMLIAAKTLGKATLHYLK